MPTTAGVRALSSGVDTLAFSVRGQLRHDFVERVETLKARGAGEAEMVSTFASDGLEFVLAKHGVRGYPFLLKASGYDVILGAKEPFPPVLIEIRSRRLHELGAEESVREVVERLEGDVFEGSCVLLPSRIDVYADIQGWEPVLSDFERFACRAKHRELYQPEGRAYDFGSELSGYKFGKGPVVGRIYNKTLEQRVKTDRGASIFWDGMDADRPVWRIEFQFRRTALVEFGLASSETVLQNRQGLWWQGLDWLSLRARSHHAKRSRWPEDPMWQWLRTIAIGLPCNQLVRTRMRRVNYERTISALAGHLSSLGAMVGRDDLLDVLSSAAAGVTDYLTERDASFEAKVGGKRARLRALWGKADP